MRAGMVRPTFVVGAVLCAVLLYFPITDCARLSAQTDQRRLGRDQATVSEKRVALVIGNGAYTKGRLRNPPNDARSMAAALRDSGVGFDGTEVIDADKVHIQRAIRDFGTKLRASGGVGLFYYAGHGVQVSGRNYLVPIGAETEVEKESDVEIFCIDAEAVLRQMEDSGARVNIVILDACGDNPFARSFRRGGAGDGLAEINAPSGTLIAYSTDPGKTASDGDGENGLYIQELLARIKQPGLRIEDVFNQAGAEVERKSRRAQQPWISSKLRGAFYFRPPAESATANPNPKPIRPADPAVAEQEAWELVRESSDPEDYREFLKLHPNGVNAGTAKLKLRKLESASKPAPSTPTGSDTSSRPPATSRPDKAKPPGCASGLPASKADVPSPGTQMDGAAGIKLVYIPAGEFQMGSPSSEVNRSTDEGPVHRVVITEPFWMGKFEVTQAQWESVMGVNPGYFKNCSQCPVEYVSWYDCQEFIRKLNARGDGNTKALPTEGKWEYACNENRPPDSIRAFFSR